jgi:dephospho-CoA kinase
MITAIIGKSGSGKTTIAKILAKSYDVFVEVDALVKELYSKEETIMAFSCSKTLSTVIVDGKIDKSLLIKLISKDVYSKNTLENYLYENAFLPIIRSCREQGKSLLMDGLTIPVYMIKRDFDQIITVDAPDMVRRANLEKRGVSRERIDEIFELQRYLT